MKWSFQETRAGFTYEVTVEAEAETPDLHTLEDFKKAVFDPTSGVHAVETRLIEGGS